MMQPMTDRSQDCFFEINLFIAGEIAMSAEATPDLGGDLDLENMNTVRTITCIEPGLMIFNWV